jgi:hypothetical protein
MSVYHGPQGPGASRAHHAAKREEAERRNAHALPENRKQTRQAGCPSGKTILRTEKEAQTELVGTLVRKNRGNNRRKECRWYHCNLCGFYHLTSKPIKTQPKEQQS